LTLKSRTFQGSIICVSPKEDQKIKKD
jgi:hypothetical protein